MAFRVAESNYVPSYYEGRVVLFRTREGPSADPEGMEQAWSRVVRKLELREASGNHDTMLTPPYIDGLARMVRECIDGQTGVSIGACAPVSSNCSRSV